eukprot:Platyproteum_vivax@DN7482_c0_g3_i1.p1
MRLIVCVLLFGLALVGQCVRMKSQLRNRLVLQSKATALETSDVWMMFGKKVANTMDKFEPDDLVDPAKFIAATIWDRRFNGEITPEAAICIHDYPERLVEQLGTIEEEMYSYLLSMDPTNGIYFFYFKALPQPQPIEIGHDMIINTKIPGFTVNNKGRFPQVAEYDWDTATEKLINGKAQGNMFTKVVEDVWDRTWDHSGPDVNTGKLKRWLLLAYANKQDMVEGLIAVNNVPIKLDEGKLVELVKQINEKFKNQNYSVSGAVMRGGDHYFGGKVTIENKFPNLILMPSFDSIIVEWTVGKTETGQTFFYENDQNRNTPQTELIKGVLKDKLPKWPFGTAKVYRRSSQVTVKPVSRYAKLPEVAFAKPVSVVTDKSPLLENEYDNTRV